MGALCSAKLRNGDPCRSVATQGEFCGYHRALAEELGYDLVADGGQTKRRNARQREPVIAESEPLELPSRAPGSPSAFAGTRSHRRRGSRDDPACAARGRDQHHARDVGNLHLPGVRQELPAGDLRPRPWRPNQGGRDVAREGLGRVGEAEFLEPRMPTAADEVKNLSDDELYHVFALTHATQIRAVVENGDDATGRSSRTGSRRSV